MPSGPPVDGSSEIDDLTSLLRKLAADRREDQDRRESDRELRRQDDERLKTQVFEEMDHRVAAVSEVASGFTGIICILAGVLGLSAVYFKNARSAKVYMLSWPAKFLLGLWTTVDMVRSMKKYGVTQQGHAFSILALNTIFLLYFFKVSWSYYKRLDHKNNGSSGGVGGSAPSDIEGPAIAMLTVNSRV